MKIDLNADVGEGYSTDEELIPFISSANIACGYHAGNWDTILHTTELCIKNGVTVGAHPSFPDRENFGRKEMQLSDDSLRNLLLEQLQLIDKACRELGVSLHHVKPHGALYNMSARNIKLAELIAETVFGFNPSLKLYGLSGSFSISEGVIAGLSTVAEVFADRSYEEDGGLTPRTFPNAVHDDEQIILEQAIGLAKGQKVMARTGKEISVMAESICLHGDSPRAVSSARLIHNKFKELGITIQSV